MSGARWTPHLSEEEGEEEGTDQRPPKPTEHVAITIDGTPTDYNPGGLCLPAPWQGERGSWWA